MRTTSTRSTIAVAAVLAVSLSALAGGSASAGRRRGAIAALKDSTGRSIGVVRLVPRDGKVMVAARAVGLAPGFHGFHVHTSGICDPAVSDTNPSAFATAGGHYNSDAANTHGAHSGDMPALLVASDGTARLRLATDRFKLSELFDEDGAAIIVHAGADNLGNVPATTATGGERYHSHVEDLFGPDSATKATGDAGARFACGVVERV